VSAGVLLAASTEKGLVLLELVEMVNFCIPEKHALLYADTEDIIS
jgi:hypothetical protein